MAAILHMRTSRRSVKIRVILKESLEAHTNKRQLKIVNNRESSNTCHIITQGKLACRNYKLNFTHHTENMPMLGQT